MVGVNRFRQEEDRPRVVFRLDPELERQQVARLRELRASRDRGCVEQRLKELEQAARGSENLMPRILAACEAFATVGEISDRLRTVFGEYRAGLRSISLAGAWPDARRHGRWRERRPRGALRNASRARPRRTRPCLAELVCSNSLKSEQEKWRAVAVKEELRRLAILLIGEIAPRAHPAGHALTVDRDIFAAEVPANAPA